MSEMDFGFASQEFLGQIKTIPYAQFLNASNSNYGIAVTSDNAELAGLGVPKTWKTFEHEFSSGQKKILFLTDCPKLLVINRSQPFMSNEIETIPYNKEKFIQGEYKAFSYAIVWFLDDNNQPLSELPFRLKCSGYSGLTFLKNYSYHNNANSFCKKFLQVYKSLTKDRAVDKNETFYAHGIYQPILVRKKATSSINGQSSFAVMTDSFIPPTEENFASLIIKNGSEVSNKIKELMESTKDWLKYEKEPEVEESNKETQEVVEVKVEVQPEPESLYPMEENSFEEAEAIPF